MFDNFDAIPSGFVFNEVYKLRPTSVGYGFSQVVILDHALDVECFHADMSKLINDLPTEFMVKVFTPVSDLFVGCGDNQPRLVSAITALDFAVYSALPNFQQAFRFTQWLRRLNLGRFALTAENGKILQAKINADRLPVSRWLNILFNLALDGGEIVSGLGFRHGTVFRLTFHCAMKNDFDPANFRQVEFTAFDLKALRVADRLIVVLRPESWIPFRHSIFPLLLSWLWQCSRFVVAEKVLIGAVGIFQRRLQDLTIRFFQPSEVRLLLHGRNLLFEVVKRYTVAGSKKGRLAAINKAVIDKSGMPKLHRQTMV